jgi:hypothetical protein
LISINGRRISREGALLKRMELELEELEDAADLIAQ